MARRFLLAAITLALSAGAAEGQSPIVTYSVAAADGIVETVRVVDDGAGNTYVAGNVYRGRRSGDIVRIPSDVFITRLDRDGNVVWTRSFGGSLNDQALGLALDAAGHTYIVGHTYSTDFPTLNAFQGQFPAEARRAGFLARLDATGATVYSTYLAGRWETSITAVAAGPGGTVYVAGVTDSPDFPTTAGSLLPRIGQDYIGRNRFAFVARLNSTGRTLFYSTYLGGVRASCVGGSRCIGVVGHSGAAAIAVDGAGNAFLAGTTSAIDFPVTPNAFQRSCACSMGSGDAFIAKLNATGSALIYATYIGGSPYGTQFAPAGGEAPHAFAIDAGGNVYMAGQTTTNFPVTPGALQTQPPWNDPISPRRAVGFAFKLDSTGRSLLYSTYFGGTAGSVTGIAIEGDGSLWISGSDIGGGFPITPGGFPRGGDGLVHLDSSGARLLASTRLPRGMAGGGLARSGTGVFILAGGTSGIVSRVKLSSERRPSLLGVANAAGFSLSPRIAPGEIISLYGLEIGPAVPAFARLEADGRIATELSGVRVFFNSLPAPLLYAQRDQINAIVPYRIYGERQGRLQIVRDGVTVAQRTIATAFSEPEIFRWPGTSMAIALNEDGTLNSAENPARLGSAITIWATGEGSVLPQALDGEIISAPLPRPVLPVSVAGIPVEVEYAGAAPGQVAGLMQVNIRLPQTALPPITFITLQVGENFSDRAGLYIAQRVP